MATLDATGQITCGDLTVGGSTIQNLVDNASGGGLTQSDLNLKQNKLTAGTNIISDSSTIVISATVGVTQSDLSSFQPQLNSNVSITTGPISSSSIIARSDAAISASTIRAGTDLLIGSGDISTINVLDKKKN